MNSDNIDLSEVKVIKQSLEYFTEQIKTDPLYRSEIIKALKPYKIDHLYLIDLTCNVFTKYIDKDNWSVVEHLELEQFLNREKLRGGIRKNYTKKSRKSKKSKKSRNLKPRQKRKR